MARTVPAAVTRRPALRFPVSSRSDPVSRLAPTPMRNQSGFFTTASARDARASLLGSGIAFIVSPLSLCLSKTRIVVLRNFWLSVAPCTPAVGTSRRPGKFRRRRYESKRCSGGFAGGPGRGRMDVRLIHVELAQGFALRGILGLLQCFSEFLFQQVGLVPLGVDTLAKNELGALVAFAHGLGSGLQILEHAFARRGSVGDHHPGGGVDLQHGAAVGTGNFESLDGLFGLFGHFTENCRRWQGSLHSRQARVVEPERPNRRRVLQTRDFFGLLLTGLNRPSGRKGNACGGFWHLRHLLQSFRSSELFRTAVPRHRWQAIGKGFSTPTGQRFT